MACDIRIDLAQQIICKFGDCLRCARLAACAVPDGRDIEAKLAQATIAVIQCCSQKIGQRFAVGVAGESGGVHIQFVDDAMRSSMRKEYIR